MSTVAYRFLTRGGTAANLATVNAVPLARELVVETDTGKVKLGDGVTPYNELPYIQSGIPDAPEDGKQYARKDAGWVEVVGGGGGGAGNMPVAEVSGSQSLPAESPQYLRFIDGIDPNQLSLSLPAGAEEFAEYMVRNAGSSALPLIAVGGTVVAVPPGYMLAVDPGHTIRIKRVGPSTLDLSGELKRITAYQWARFDTGPGSFSWTVPEGVYAVDVLIVGGGGGGRGGGTGNVVPYGGAGAGGLILLSGIAVTPGAVMPVVVGAGGVGIAPGQPVALARGGVSSFAGFTAYGGSPEPLPEDLPVPPVGSGWGGRGEGIIPGGAPTAGQGYAGGDGIAAPTWSAGGGGGAGGPGANASTINSQAGGAGGPGLVTNISGYGQIFAAGGGGGAYGSGRIGGAGGSDGVGGKGGNGSSSSSADSARNGGHAKPNTGSGGGSGGTSSNTGAPASLGGNGSAGVVIIRWAAPLGP